MDHVDLYRATEVMANFSGRPSYQDIFKSKGLKLLVFYSLPVGEFNVVRYCINCRGERHFN